MLADSPGSAAPATPGRFCCVRSTVGSVFWPYRNALLCTAMASNTQRNGYEMSGTPRHIASNRPMQLHRIQRFSCGIFDKILKTATAKRRNPTTPTWLRMEVTRLEGRLLPRPTPSPWVLTNRSSKNISALKRTNAETELPLLIVCAITILRSDGTTSNDALNRPAMTKTDIRLVDLHDIPGPADHPLRQHQHQYQHGERHQGGTRCHQQAGERRQSAGCIPRLRSRYIASEAPEKAASAAPAIEGSVNDRFGRSW